MQKCMNKGLTMSITDVPLLASWNLRITAIVAGICLGQHFINVYVDYLTDRKMSFTLQTTIDKLQQELEQERVLVSILRSEVKLEKQATEEAMKQRSALTPSRLIDGNTNIVDLGDQNRPMKVGEQFSKLYDNQWTDAYNAVENHFEKDDFQITAFLLNILEQCFNACQVKAVNQLERLQKDVNNLETLITKKRTKLPNDLMQLIKEERKHSAADEAPEYAKMLPQLKIFVSSNVRVKRGLLEESELKDYIQECLRLSWLMVIQDPPIAMELKPIENAGDIYKVYNHRGKRVAYIVWPALLLQEGGQLISKGVAEF